MRGDDSQPDSRSVLPCHALTDARGQGVVAIEEGNPIGRVDRRATADSREPARRVSVPTKPHSRVHGIRRRSQRAHGDGANGDARQSSVHGPARRPVHAPDRRRGAHVAPREYGERSIDGPERGRKTHVKRSTDPHEREVANRQEQPEDANTKEKEIDQILADSFPASDAPPWTLGVTEKTPKNVRKRKGRSG